MLVLVSTSGGGPHRQQMGKNVLSTFEFLSNFLIGLTKVKIHIV
jgi:hypothetical protein